MTAVCLTFAVFGLIIFWDIFVSQNVSTERNKAKSARPEIGIDTVEQKAATRIGLAQLNAKPSVRPKALSPTQCINSLQGVTPGLRAWAARFESPETRFGYDRRALLDVLPAVLDHSRLDAVGLCEFGRSVAFVQNGSTRPVAECGRLAVSRSESEMANAQESCRRTVRQALWQAEGPLWVGQDAETLIRLYRLIKTPGDSGGVTEFRRTVGLAGALYLTGRLDQASQELARLDRLIDQPAPPPLIAEYYWLNGMIAFDRGLFDKASASLKDAAAVENFTHVKEAAWQLIDALTAAGRPDEAEQRLRQYETRYAIPAAERLRLLSAIQDVKNSRRSVPQSRARDQRDEVTISVSYSRGEICRASSAGVWGAMSLNG